MKNNYLQDTTKNAEVMTPANAIASVVGFVILSFAKVHLKGYSDRRNETTNLIDAISGLNYLLLCYLAAVTRADMPSMLEEQLSNKYYECLELKDTVDLPRELHEKLKILLENYICGLIRDKRDFWIKSGGVGATTIQYKRLKEGDISESVSSVISDLRLYRKVFGPLRYWLKSRCDP